jgi:HPt (histidine-containing phosphotransfer) domain-containing protein
VSKFVVRIDADISDLIPGFLGRKRKDADAIRAAAETGDYATLADLAHKIKGEGGSYGLNRISEIGAELELAARERNLAEVRRQADGLITYLDCVEIVFE